MAATTTDASRGAIRAIALVEACKGLVVLLAATGVLALVHHDLNALAARLVAHSHLNPASKYPHIFLDAVAHLQQPRLLWLALGAAAYSALRLLEAYGLYRQRAWAEWLAALSGGIYLPFEVAELAHRPTALGALVLVVNLAVVGVMAWALVRRRAGAS
ncbi:DUF2127 domain-containing protein [Pseudorhodoferax sp.]|uniref:DUF2127 domain-containing protein n=1 Tax=Pseudorhodoferax sp. TaxID=1993553 RepID=UPI0039E54332